MSLNQSQLALSNAPYHKCSLKYTLDSLQRLGARKIEFVCCEPHFYFDDVRPGEAVAFRKELSGRGLEVACLTPPTVEYPMNLASEHLATRKKTVDYLVRAIQYAAELESPLVAFDAGMTTLDGSFSAAWARSGESLAYLAGLAESYGVRLALCVAGGRKDSLLNGSANAARMKKELGSPAVGFTMDTVSLSQAGEALEAFLAEVGAENIWHVRFADRRNSALHLAPGEGALDLECILKGLEQAGYKGALSLYMRGSREPYVYEEEPERCMRAGAEWLRARLG